MDENCGLARAVSIMGASLAIALYGAISTSEAAASSTQSSAFAEALISAERSPEITAAEDIYAPLLGSWNVEARDRTDDGTFKVTHGEWLFARTLEGRAVQDVWIAPSRPNRSADTTRVANRYGSSLRTFDPKARRWQVTWLNPVTGAFNVLFTHMEGKRIVQEGQLGDGQRIRWIFEEITPDSFHWTGESQQPDGSWRLDAEFFGRRRS